MIIFRFKYALTLALLSLASCGREATWQEQYSGPWTEPSGEVAVVLGQKGTKGCGEFWQKANKLHKREYAIACNRMPDDSGRADWVGYVVWTGTGEMLGPDLTAVYLKFGGPPKPDPR